MILYKQFVAPLNHTILGLITKCLRVFVCIFLKPGRFQQLKYIFNHRLMINKKNDALFKPSQPVYSSLNRRQILRFFFLMKQHNV